MGAQEPAWRASILRFLASRITLAMAEPRISDLRSLYSILDRLEERFGGATRNSAEKHQGLSPMRADVVLPSLLVGSSIV